ncbi:NAD(P)-binding protein [Setomelanomma holmii]|uniref:NAD(P)-binding protein n=1 Tax=Setomelanomma holmii TaxID=210430 RepID=A0A9P4HHS5_9PLEO|nr:NAD(P)-binding protein [Setomelanomma holmii]
MSFPYKHVLLIGATSGIGKALANHFIAQNIKVTAIGRRQAPIDCVFLNAATQTRANFSKPETVDLAAFHRESSVNFNSQVALVHAVLPHLLKHTGPAGLIFTGTPVTLVPAFPMPSYCASKAALEAFIICLREQLRDTNVKVQHISPGPVRTELHDAELGKDAGSKFGMSLKEFVNESWTGLAAGEEDVYPGCVGGSTKEQWLELVRVRDAMVGRMTGLLRKVMQAQNA